MVNAREKRADNPSGVSFTPVFYGSTDPQRRHRYSTLSTAFQSLGQTMGIDIFQGKLLYVPHANANGNSKFACIIHQHDGGGALSQRAAGIREQRARYNRYVSCHVRSNFHENVLSPWRTNNFRIWENFMGYPRYDKNVDVWEIVLLRLDEMINKEIAKKSTFVEKKSAECNFNQVHCIEIDLKRWLFGRV